MKFAISSIFLESITYRRRDRRTDGPTDGRTDTPSQRCEDASKKGRWEARSQCSGPEDGRDGRYVLVPQVIVPYGTAAQKAHS